MVISNSEQAFNTVQSISMSPGEKKKKRIYLKQNQENRPYTTEL